LFNFLLQSGFSGKKELLIRMNSKKSHIITVLFVIFGVWVFSLGLHEPTAEQLLARQTYPYRSYGMQPVEEMLSESSGVLKIYGVFIVIITLVVYSATNEYVSWLLPYVMIGGGIVGWVMWFLLFTDRL